MWSEKFFLSRGLLSFGSLWVGDTLGCAATEQLNSGCWRCLGEVWKLGVSPVPGAAALFWAASALIFRSAAPGAVSALHFSDFNSVSIFTWSSFTAASSPDCCHEFSNFKNWVYSPPDSFTFSTSSLEAATKPPVLLHQLALLKEFCLKSSVWANPYSLLFFFLTAPPVDNIFGHDFSSSGESLQFHYSDCSDETLQVMSDLCVLPHVAETEWRWVQRGALGTGAVLLL